MEFELGQGSKAAPFVKRDGTPIVGGHDHMGRIDVSGVQFGQKAFDEKSTGPVTLVVRVDGNGEQLGADADSGASVTEGLDTDRQVRPGAARR